MSSPSRRRRRRALAAGLLALAVAPSCLSFSFSSSWREEPIPPQRDAALQVGSTRIDTILETLGAPHFVRRARDSGTWLIWAWAKKGGWSIRASYPIRFTSVSLSWEDDADAVQGLALRLDDALVLREKARGVLSAIIRGADDPQRKRRRATPGL